MAYTMVKCRTEEYAVDWGVVERFVRNYHRSVYQNSLSTVVKMSESSWYNPLSWKMPEIATLDVPWDQVNTWADRAVQSDLASYRANAANNMRDIAYDVQYKMEQVSVQKGAFKGQLRDVQHQNYAAIQNAADGYSGAVEWLKFIRDSSADVVMLGSTIATAGAAAPFLLAGGAAMKGGFKYQDTGSAGAAILYGVGSAFLSSFKFAGKTLTTGGEIVLICVNGALETGVGIAAGDKFGKAFESGALKVASQGIAQTIFGNRLVKRLFQRMPLPFAVWTGNQQFMTDEANDMAAKVSKKMTENTAKFVGKRLLKPGEAVSEADGAGVIDDVPFEDRLLLYLAIVNMEKGIGRGW